MDTSERTHNYWKPPGVFKDVEVATVDAFQGGEREAIALCCGRPWAAYSRRQTQRVQYVHICICTISVRVDIDVNITRNSSVHTKIHTDMNVG